VLTNNFLWLEFDFPKFCKHS